MQRWVLGILSMEFQPPRPIFQVIDGRSAATLLPIINHHVRRGTTVTTDGWRGYQQLRFRYRTVNHSLYFVDPITGKFILCLKATFSVAKMPLIDTN